MTLAIQMNVADSFADVLLSFVSFLLRRSSRTYAVIGVLIRYR